MTETTTNTESVNAPLAPTIHLVPHFHVDAVWWNTQGATIDQFETSDWSGSPRLGFQRSAIDVLRQHVARAERDPIYRFCVAEVDYLEPLWFHHPQERSRLRRLIDREQVEVVGATYNEPNTNLTGAEATRRNLEHGLRFQHGALGATVRTAWQLDVFGHDPSFPSQLASVGVDGVYFARGPFGPWGPMLDGPFDQPSEPGPVQFPSEIEWIAPDGTGVLASWVPAHYSTGYRLDRADSIDEAADFVVDLASKLRHIAPTGHLIVLVGTDLAPPSRWVTDLVRWSCDDESRPTILCSTPTDALDAVRSELQARGSRPVPVSRDMNPVYTGKDVTAIDLKLAFRATERTLADAAVWLERVDEALDPHTRGRISADLDDAWRGLVYAAHHDAVTGTHSDQVHLDLLSTCRHAWAIARSAERKAASALAGSLVAGARTAACVDDDGPAIVLLDPRRGHEKSGGRGADVVTFTLGAAELRAVGADGSFALVDDGGRPVAFVVERVQRDARGAIVLAVVTAVVAAGNAPGGAPIGTDPVLRVRPSTSPPPQWLADAGTTIRNRFHDVTVDPELGGCVVSWIDRPTGRQMIADDDTGAELVWFEEHPELDGTGEGPWHLAPRRIAARSSDVTVAVERTTSPVGERIVIAGEFADVASVERTSPEGNGLRSIRPQTPCTFSTELTLWRDVDRVDLNVSVDGVVGADQLLRLRWPCPIRGALPVANTGADVAAGRSVAHVDVDAVEHPATLDAPTNGWIASSVCARLDVGGADLAFGVSEVVVDDRFDPAHAAVRDLVVALGNRGVTATTSASSWPRFGALGFDSHVPDVRLVVGFDDDPVVAGVLERLDVEARAEVEGGLDAGGAVVVAVPGTSPRSEVWEPSVDVRAVDRLPVAAIVGRAARADELVAAVNGVAARLAATGRIDADHHPSTLPPWMHDETPEDAVVALVENGTPGCAVDAAGTIWTSLLRSPTGWPVGQWIDPPARRTPDGSPFLHGHGSHRFSFSMLSGRGTWRDSEIDVRAARVAHPLRAVVAATVGSSRASASANGSANESVPEPGVFSRWWTQGRGPRQSEHGPIAVHLHPPDRGPAARWVVTVARAPTHVDASLDAAVLDVDMKIEASAARGAPIRRRLRLGPDEYDTIDLEITAADARWTDPSDGHHVVRASARVATEDGPLVSQVFDERVVSIGTDDTPFEIVADPASVVVCAGGVAVGEIGVANRCDVAVIADLDVLAPWSAWESIVEDRGRLALEPRSVTTVPIRFEPPATARAGRWWWLVRVAVGQHVLYSDTAPLVLAVPDLDSDV